MLLLKILVTHATNNNKEKSSQQSPIQQGSTKKLAQSTSLQLAWDMFAA